MANRQTVRRNKAVLVQFDLVIRTSLNGGYFITLPIPRSRQRAYFYL